MLNALAPDCLAPGNSTSPTSSFRRRRRRWKRSSGRSIERLAPLQAAFRLRHLWRRRLDARAHPQHRRAASSRETRYEARRASDLRLRRRATRSTRSCAAIGTRACVIIVALRGDPPSGVGTTLRAAIRRLSHLHRARARHLARSAISKSRSRPIPKAIPRARPIEHDLDALEAKIDAGATRAITQFFFDNDVYFRFLDKARARGITIPIVPGIMPVQQLQADGEFREQGRRERAAAGSPIVSRGSTTIPRRARSSPPPSPPSRCSASPSAGVDQFHFYTNNRADLVFAICHLLGVRPLREKVAA